MIHAQFVASVALEHAAATDNRSPEVAAAYEQAFNDTPDSLWAQMYESGIFTPATAYSEWVSQRAGWVHMRVEALRAAGAQRTQLLARVDPDVKAKVERPKRAIKRNTIDAERGVVDHERKTK